MVHDQFNEKQINDIRERNPGIKIIAHPECPPEVIQASDFAGSTGGMIDYVKNNQPHKVMMVTECSMSDNCLLYTSPSPRDYPGSRMPSSA